MNLDPRYSSHGLGYELRGKVMSNVQTWREGLSSHDVETRSAAAESLCYAGQEAAPAVVELVRVCGDDESVQTWAVAALEAIGTPPAETMSSLTDLASDKDPTVAYWAVTLLGRLANAAVEAETILSELLLNSPDLAVRERAAWALGKIGPQSQPALDALREAVDSGDSRLARVAQEALAQASNNRWNEAAR